MKAKDTDFSGAWHSVYHFTGTVPAGEFTSEHDVRIHRSGNQVVIQSEPNEEGSYLLLRLTIDDRILTGSWQEESSPSGVYKGEVYYGGIQLIMDENGNAMRGKYVGMNRNMQVQNGDWEIIRVA